jgi:8-oxo-dGTP pyrophosphatase MutT (NUDIX family)
VQRRHLLENVHVYRETWADGLAPYPGFDAAEEERNLTKFQGFVARYPDCFQREQQAGHVTGSALIVSPDLRQVLLTLHAKLGKWLQLGGHADGEGEVHEVAYREAVEESGLKRIRFFPYERLFELETDRDPLPFDFDCHDIPERKGEPAHVHYDVRYLVVADPAEPLKITAESKDLKWFSLAEARTLTKERSMLRQFDKVDWIRGRLS